MSWCWRRRPLGEWLKGNYWNYWVEGEQKDGGQDWLSGRQRSQEHTGSPSNHARNRGIWGKWGRRKERKLSSSQFLILMGSLKRNRGCSFSSLIPYLCEGSVTDPSSFFSNHFFFPFLFFLLSFLLSTLPLLSSDWLEHLHVEELLDVIIAPNHWFVNTGNCNCF